MARHIRLSVNAEVRRPLLTCAAAKDFLRQAVRLARMNIIDGPSAVYGNVPGNEGVSATAILDYSSTSLHEWPFRSPARFDFDLYTCGPVEPTLKLFRPLFARLEPISIAAMSVDLDSMTVIGTNRWHELDRAGEASNDGWLPDAIRR